MKKVLRHWPIPVAAVAFITFLVSVVLSSYTQVLDAIDPWDLELFPFLLVFPLLSFLSSLYYGIILGGFKKLWIVLICGIAYVAAYLLEFLITMMLPDFSACFEISLLALIPAAIGMALGSLIRLVVLWIRKRH